MLLSVFTPTNNPQFLHECHDSLKAQDYSYWEWVIAPNGEAVGKIPEEIAEDNRVKVVNYEGPPNIGAMKKFCCEKSLGEVLVELDHDDMLVPNILSCVADKFKEGAGFVYSDAAVFSGDSDNPQPTGYDEHWGWETYPFRVYGREFLATRAFDISPRSLCEVYYAPDHIRCWSKEVYDKVGGHDENLEVGDDHDLICRTYLSGCQFAHTNTCGYLYRSHPGNTVKSHNAAIQEQQFFNRDKYIYKLIDHWVARKQHTYLDLTSDNEQLVFDDDGRPTIIQDDNSVGSIRAYDMVHRIPQDQVNALMEECYRVLVPGGWLCVAAPSTDGAGGFMPFSKSLWNEKSFDVWSYQSYADMLGGTKARFQKVRCSTQIPSNMPLVGVPYVYADLCALKGQRQPGRVYI